VRAFCKRGFKKGYGAAGAVEVVGAVQLGDIVLSADGYFALVPRHMAAHGGFFAIGVKGVLKRGFWGCIFGVCVFHRDFGLRIFYIFHKAL